MIFLLGFLGYICLIRNTQVLLFRNKIVNHIGRSSNLQSKTDLDDYRKVDYLTMLIQFWKPLTPQTWWPNTWFWKQLVDEENKTKK